MFRVSIKLHYIYIYIYIYIYQDIRTTKMLHKVYFKRSLTGLNSKFSFSEIGHYIKIKEPSYSYLLIVEGRI